MSERINRIRSRMKKKPQICIAAYQIIQNTYESMSGEPVVACRGQATYNILTQIPIFIKEEERIVGCGASKENALEIDSANGTWTKEEIDALREDGYSFDEADEEILYELNKRNPPYSLADGAAEVVEQGSYLIPFLRSGMGLTQWLTLEKGRQSLQCSAQGGMNLTPAQALVCLDYEKVLRTGVEVMIHQCEEEMDKIRFDKEKDYDHYLYLRAMKKSLEGLLAYGERYASLAEQMAEKEDKEDRKKELQEIAKICQQVPAKPARNFKEALQMYWFIFHTVACPNGVLGMGRLDQLLYPYYKKDIEAGQITKEEVCELLQELRLKDMELGIVCSKDNRKTSNGEARWHNLAIGGVKKDGSDATNELSYLILDALLSCPTLHPTITIRVADSTPDSLLIKGLECVRKGLSMPTFIGDKSYLAFFEKNGVPKDMAREYVPTGCIDANLPGNSRTMMAGMFITPMCLDVFMHRGVNLMNGETVGHDYGDMDTWTCYEDFLAAFKEEFQYFISLMAHFSNLTIISMRRYFPEPLKTAFMYGGIEDATDYQIKNMPFENAGVICPVGLINLGNSLMVVKKLVFDEKKITMNELIQAMDANWHGYEWLQKECLRVDKYGNDLDEVDAVTADIFGYFEYACSQQSCVTDSMYRGSAISIFGHAPGGALTGATPDGRVRGEVLADAGASPMRGQDINGPLASLRSGMKLPQVNYQAVLLNMKFNSLSTRTESDLRKIITLIRVYFEHYGKHIQFNIVDYKTLQDAKLHPDEHQDLMVRVAGYSAYFVALTDRLQDEIIERTEKEL